jgi:signal peptidase I
VARAAGRQLHEVPLQPLRTAQVLVVATLLALALLIGLRIGSIEGLWRVARVDGSSMAPALCGLHYRVVCDDCDFPFRCDAEHAPGDGLATCPNCGYAKNQLTAGALQLAEEVLIDRWQGWWQKPRRYETVAVRDVPAAGLAVKRVAGLPGEHLAIREGDLYAGQRIVQKSPAEWREVRELVHSNDFLPHLTPDLSPRWQSDSAISGWHASGTHFRYRPQQTSPHKPEGQQPEAPAKPPAPSTDSLDWLVYHHWRCLAGPVPRTKLSPVLDNDSYNQAATRELNAVPDVQLSCRIRAQGQGRLALAAVDGDQRFEVIFEAGPEGWSGRFFESPATAHNNGQRNYEISEIKEGRALSIPNLSGSVPTELEFGLCDRQVLLSIGRRLALRHSYERKGNNPTLHPLAIGASGLHVEVSRLRVWRDQYLLEPLGTARSWQADRPLPADAYFLLGDNLAVSTDSRHWPAGGTARRQILGPVYRPFWAR